MYDLIVIGAGPGGYIAAERAGEMGKSVLLVEKAHLGGVCTNEGCIPTKSLLNSAKHYVYGTESAKFGVHFDNPRFDLKEAMSWKQGTIESLRKQIAFLMKSRKVEVVFGEALFNGGKTVTVDGKTYEGANIIIATGSSAVVPPIPGADSPAVVTSREILEIDKVPGKLVVIGGGVIGIEFASFFSSIGVEVHIVEMLDEIIPFMDKELAGMMRKRAMKNINFHLGARVESIEGTKVRFSENGKAGELDADCILMAIGRKANTEGLEQLGLDISRKGIKVDEKMRTNIPGIYAIGDVTGESLLAHSASRMAEVAVNVMFGQEDRMRYNAIPWAVYSLPEAAGCGLTEDDAKKQGLNVKTSSVQMRANGRFLAEHGAKSPGICKVVADADSGLLLGVHLLGAVSSEMIYGAAVMLESELRIKEINEIVFPHPSVSEVIKDACKGL